MFYHRSYDTILKFITIFIVVFKEVSDAFVFVIFFKNFQNLPDKIYDSQTSSQQIYESNFVKLGEIFWKFSNRETAIFTNFFTDFHQQVFNHQVRSTTAGFVMNFLSKKVRPFLKSIDQCHTLLLLIIPLTYTLHNVGYGFQLVSSFLAIKPSSLNALHKWRDFQSQCTF